MILTCTQGTGSSFPPAQPGDQLKQATLILACVALLAACGGGGGDGNTASGTACADVCVIGAVNADGSACELWNESAEAWAPFADGAGQLHNRARSYLSKLRSGQTAAGGVFTTRYADATLKTLSSYDTINDSALWTGTYLAAEALRYLTTDTPDARQQIETTVSTLHDWWNIAGDSGYLARFAAPVDSSSQILAIFDPTRPRDHLDVPFKGSTWHWKGEVSRDQYQGVLLGYSLAYDAVDDPAVRDVIRNDVLAFVEQLMRSDTKEVLVTIDASEYSVDVEMPYTVFTDDDTANGLPHFVIDTSDLGNSTIAGIREFHPRVSDILRQIPDLSFLPEIRRPGTAVMLGAAFQIALQVTEDVAEFAPRRAAIESFYAANVDEWITIASDWAYTESCGDDYFGIHIVYQPAYTWARLETNPTRKATIRDDILQARLWEEVKDHNNVLFAFITAAQAPQLADSNSIVAHHRDQLALFPPPPRVREARDNTGSYQESATCPGNATVALNLHERGVYDYLWQKHPWLLVRSGDPQKVYPGVDYLIAYWLGRYHDFIADDAAGTCLRWREQ